jgi:hypothetical protein
LHQRHLAALVLTALVGMSGARAQDEEHWMQDQDQSIQELYPLILDKYSLIPDADPLMQGEDPWAQYDDTWVQDQEPFDSRDWRGIKRDLVYLIGWQVVATVIIYSAPYEVSNWHRTEKENLGIEQWARNVTDPVWDEDHWSINYVLHPYWGAGYYIRGRERGFSQRESFWVSVVFSSVYEFGIESFLEKPSIQDLIVTPVVGTGIGLYFEKVRSRILNQAEPPSGWDKLKLGLTDPFGALNRGVNRLFGIQEYGEPQAMINVRLLEDNERHVDGLQLTFEYRW